MCTVFQPVDPIFIYFTVFIGLRVCVFVHKYVCTMHTHIATQSIKFQLSLPQKQLSISFTTSLTLLYILFPFIYTLCSLLQIIGVCIISKRLHFELTQTNRDDISCCQKTHRKLMSNRVQHTHSEREKEKDSNTVICPTITHYLLFLLLRWSTIRAKDGINSAKFCPFHTAQTKQIFLRSQSIYFICAAKQKQNETKKIEEIKRVNVICY